MKLAYIENLAEEWSEAAELVMAPVLKKSLRLRRHQPVVRILEFPSWAHLKE